MTTAAVHWVDLAQGAQQRRPPGARRLDALIFVLVVVGHLLVLTRFSQPAKPPLPLLDDLPVLTVSLMPALPRARTSAPAAVEPSPSPVLPRPAPEHASVHPAEVATPELPLRPEQLGPVSLTAAPIPLSGTPPPALSAPSSVVGATDAQSEACDFTGALKAVLQASPAVLDELSHIPRQARSVANAIMLWDGHWAKVDTPGFLAMADPLHQTILALVGSLPPVCQAQAIAGPRLLTIAGPEGTTVIVLGSGAWRWGDLLTWEGVQR
jgi:hypothetical protein